jgi:PKD repeat protein
MPRKWLALAAAVTLFAACNKENPVLPTDPNNSPGNGGSAYVITIESDRPRVETGTSAAPATLTVKAQTSDGTKPPDGTSVTINTSLGNFGTSGLGEAIKVVTRTLTNGSVSLQFYGGTEAGTANILASVGSSVGNANITIAEPAPLPTADFEFVANGLEVVFTDQSSGATSRTWNFGDNTTSTEQNPRHTYAAAGTYTVVLTAANSSGSAQKTKTVTIGPAEPPAAAFTFEKNGLTVHFTDMSTGSPVSWDWDFGDGTTSTQQNPSHTYPAVGTYTVKLTVKNAFGTSSSKSAFVEASIPQPVAAFTFEKSGLTVNFIDQSTGDPVSWFWEFGDDGISTKRNPSHTYAAAGTYSVRLTVQNVNGTTDTTSRFVEVSVGTIPVADFTFETAALRAVFTDTSTNSPTTWAWNFGDCDVSTTCTDTRQNPDHTYMKGGSYEVSLTASNAAGTSVTKKKIVTVSAGTPPVAAFSYVANQNLLVNFADKSTGDPTSWTWTFGCLGCPVKTTRNPQQQYPEPGAYTVSLEVSNAAGTSRTSEVITVGTAPTASFTYSVNAATKSVTVHDTSTGRPTAWLWNFGDCATNGSQCQATSQGPITHPYAAAGTYQITLKVMNNLGESTKTVEVVVP